MKHLILISTFLILLVSCSKKEYKTNCTFNYIDLQTKKTYKSEPVDLYVLANNSNELKAAIKHTLSSEYLLFSVDSININNYEETQSKNNKIINYSSIYFNITDMGEVYNYLNSFKKTFVLNGSLTKTNTKYSPEQSENKNFGSINLNFENRRVRLSDSNHRLLLSFEIYTLKELEQHIYKSEKQNFDNLKDGFEIYTPFSKKIFSSTFSDNSKIKNESLMITFFGRNQNFNNIRIELSFEDYVINSHIVINKVMIIYEKNDIRYYWQFFS